MKFLKVLTIVIIIAVIAVGFMACNKDVKAEGEYTIVSPDGAPALALAGLATSAQITDSLKVKPTVVSSALIEAEAIKSDFAIVPANTAAIIFNGGYEYKVVSTITNGNLYIVTNDKEEAAFELNHMIGKVIYSIKEGSVPSCMLEAVLGLNNIPYEKSDVPVEGKVAISYVNEGTNVISSLAAATAQSKIVYGNLAEPAVTNMTNKGIGINVADIQELWKTATRSEIKGFAQAVLIAKKSICDEKPEVVDAVVAKLEDDIRRAHNNPQDARNAIASIYEQTTLPAQLNALIVQNCNLKIYKAKDYKGYINITLTAIYEVNERALGGSIPAEDSGFYY